MTKKTKLKLKLFTAVMIALAAGFYSFLQWNQDEKLVLNATHSLPGWIYLRVSGEIARGDIVSACAPPLAAKIGTLLHNVIVNNYSGVCPEHTNPLLKIAAALPGDWVEADGKGEIKINGIAFAGSAPRLGSLLPVFTYKGALPEGKYLLLTHHPDGFDSRYFGLVRQDSLRYKYRLIL